VRVGDMVIGRIFRLSPVAAAGVPSLLSSSHPSRFLLSDARPSHLAALSVGLPLSLVLEHTDDPGSLMLLAPSVALRRPAVLGLPFSNDVVPMRRGDWCTAVLSRVLAYPVHASGAMLLYRSPTAALYHVMSLLFVREYEAAAAALPAAVMDGPPSAEQKWLLRQLFMSSDDRHPNALAVRLRLMAQVGGISCAYLGVFTLSEFARTVCFVVVAAVALRRAASGWGHAGRAGTATHCSR
jgi:hypothetical protein